MNFKAKKTLLAAVTPVLVLISIATNAQKPKYDSNQFQNLLIPDGKPTVFSDWGAWHSYSFAVKNNQIGGFVGPYLIESENELVADAALRFMPIEKTDTLVPKKLADITQTYLPGRIQQAYTLAQLTIEQTLEFVSNRSAVIRYTIKNNASESRQLTMQWVGGFDKKYSIAANGNSIEIYNDKKVKKIAIEYLGLSTVKSAINTANNSYTMLLGKVITLKPNQAISFYIRQSHFINARDAALHKQPTSIHTEQVFAANKMRWDGYINKALSKQTQWLQNEEYRRTVVKAIVTLMVNWRSAAGDLKHDGILPQINSYDGFWAWDSWKHAAACALFNPKLGEANMEAMFDYQDKYGMVSDCVFTDKSRNNDRDSKPPLAAWAAWKLYTETKDLTFLKRIFPKLVKYHEWWYKYRDHDKNGLCEFGATDGTLEAAAWESGMDNAVRYDGCKMIKNVEGAWSLDQESVDLNAFLYDEKLTLAKMMKVLGDAREKTYLTKAAKLKELINKTMFNTATGFYFDVKLDDKHQIDLMGSEGWDPLWAGVATQEQAKAVSVVMADEKKFNTYMPLPTFQADHKLFSPVRGYWRGPVWLDQVYFGIDGLRKYGYNDFADKLLLKTITHGEGILGTGQFRENYNPLNGDGLNVKNFSWAAAHIILLLCDK